jgi:hypothetical protein
MSCSYFSFMLHKVFRLQVINTLIAVAQNGQ